MSLLTEGRTTVLSPRSVQLAIIAAAIVMLAGLLIPGWRTLQLVQTDSRALADMERIREAVLRFVADTQAPPTLARDGDPAGVCRLLGPGLIAEASYYYPDRHQGALLDHLVTNTPRGPGQPGYEGWRGPYLEEPTADPWGFAYVVVVYPLARSDDRDCIVISAGPNGRMDGSYGSPRDAIPFGDDLIVRIVDKSPEHHAPLP